MIPEQEMLQEGLVGPVQYAHGTGQSYEASLTSIPFFLLSSAFEGHLAPSDSGRDGDRSTGWVLSFGD